MMMRVDLHMHSSFSDGDKTPEQLVAMAKEKNIFAMSITDHDTVAGLERGEVCAKSQGINFVPGIELSCFDKKDTHLLGYNIDYRNSEFVSGILALQKSRQRRMELMVDKLAKDGFDISMEEVKERCKGEVLGRPHIASVMAEKGYGTNARDVFKKYIGTGCKYYVKYHKLDVREGIDIIHKAGGKAVLAHPKLLKYNSECFEQLIKSYKAFGLDGIEVYYPCHYNEHVKLFSRLANEYGLLMTCGGDYHNDHDHTKNNMGYDVNLSGIRETLEALLNEEINI